MVSPNTTHPFDALRRSLAGALTLPGDDGWNEARRAWNLAADQRPAAVVEAAALSDVQEVMRFARRNRLKVAPQSTGHGAAVLGWLDDAILVKTAGLREVAVDPRKRTARVGAGVVSADLGPAAGEHGLAAVGGLAPTVGIAGLTLNGGIGWLGRTHGLAANNVRAVEVVTADGELRRAAADSEPDLFWALRGGGGNFGVMTALEVDLHPVPAAFGGRIVWPGDRAGELLERWRGWTREVPEAMSSVFRHMEFPDLPDLPEAMRGKRMTMVIAVHLGPERDAVDLLAPLRDAGGGAAIEDEWATVPPDGLSRVSPEPPAPAPAAGHAWLLRDLSPALIDVLAERASGSIAPLGMIELRHLGGALARIPEHHGALARLDGEYTLSSGARAPTPDAREAIEGALAALGEDAAPWLSPQALLNFRGLPTDPAAAFEPRAWDELRRVRSAYDPDSTLLASHPVPTLDP